MRSNDADLTVADARAIEMLSRSLRRWDLDAAALGARIEFSSRLRTSLGVCYPERNLIRLHPFLARPENSMLLHGVVCHEAAHIAAPIKAGRRVKPHGPEWKALVRECGYKPRVRLQVPDFHKSRQSRKNGSDLRAVFEHCCPVCQTQRLASRPQRRWRCADCVDAGLDGKLTITSILGSTRKGT